MLIINKSSIKKIIYFSISIMILFIALIFLYLYVSTYNVFNSTSTVMGTYIKQTVYCKDPTAVCAETIQSIKDLENKISWRIDKSDIYNINEAKNNEPIEVSPETLDIIDLSTKISKMTKSAFNPAILPLSKLWDFSDTNSHVIPSDDEIQKVLIHLNPDNLILDKTNKTVTKRDNQTMLDLGAIGKGTACDTAIKIYKNKSVKSGIVSVGGSIGVFGKKNDNQPFKIAIRDPFINNEIDVTFATLNIDSGFISTSGAYEKNFTYNNKFYHHILSSDTGYPIKTDLMSVTIYHSNGTISDILSTACYVLGIKNSKDLLEQFNAQAIFVTKDKKIIVSTGLKDKLNLTDKTFIIAEWI